MLTKIIEFPVRNKLIIDFLQLSRLVYEKQCRQGQHRA